MRYLYNKSLLLNSKNKRKNIKTNKNNNNILAKEEFSIMGRNI